MNVTRAKQALVKAVDLPGKTVLDVGCGNKEHAEQFELSGWKVTTLDYSADYRPDIVGQYGDIQLSTKYDLMV